MHKPGLISIWFFIGVLLLFYGTVIAASGIWELSHPAAHPVVLAELHAPLWWGLLLLVIGAIYTFRFAPRR